MCHMEDVGRSSETSCIQERSMHRAACPAYEAVTCRWLIHQAPKRPACYAKTGSRHQHAVRMPVEAIGAQFKVWLRGPT